MSTYRIVFSEGDSQLRLCRIWYGSDGSYYVGMPTPTEDRAVFSKITVNYMNQESHVLLEEAVDLAEAKREDKEVKFSHHPDGFAQFSGANLVSGKDESGKARGMAVQTWPLWRPSRGPAFGVVINRPHQILQEVSDSKSNVRFSAASIALMPGWDQLNLEGYFFPSLWRRFVRYYEGQPYIDVPHPCRAMLRLRVLFPGHEATQFGFLAVELYSRQSEDDMEGPGDDSEAPAGFHFGGPTENVRRTAEGILAEGIYCHYPQALMPARRALDYQPEYTMQEVPPQ